MTFKRFLYSRTSLGDQDIDKGLLNKGFNESFIDRCTGSKVNRPKLEQLKFVAKRGDLITCPSFEKLADKMTTLVSLIKFFNGNGVAIYFKKEEVRFDDNTTTRQKQQFEIMLSCAGHEIDSKKTKTSEAIAARKAKGLPVGRKSVVSDAMRKSIIEDFKNGINQTVIATKNGIGRATVYRVLKKEGGLK